MKQFEQNLPYVRMYVCMHVMYVRIWCMNVMIYIYIYIHIYIYIYLCVAWTFRYNYVWRTFVCTIKNYQKYEIDNLTFRPTLHKQNTHVCFTITMIC